MDKKELAGMMLKLLREGETDEMEMLCESMDSCRIHAVCDRREGISPGCYTKEEADTVISNGPLVIATLRHLRQGDLHAVEVVLKRYMA